MKLSKLNLILLLSVSSFASAWAQQPMAKLKPSWYVGAQGGVPLGVSTFSSFGADKTRAGINAGIYGGYRFNSLLSLELSMKWGKTALSAQDCCIEKGYWLGADHNRYYAPVDGMTGWGYDNLKSSVSLQQYGVQLNVNLLGLFERTKHSRWTLEVAPLLAAVGTKATIQTISENTEVRKGDAIWHLGMGGNVQAGYMLTKHIQLGIYSGATYLTGKRMDGMPEYLHENNYIWESGIRIGWTFGKSKRQKTAPIETTPAISLEEAKQTVASKPKAEQKESTVSPAQSDIAKAAASTVASKEKAEIQFPTVYFRFNSKRIDQSEKPKLHAILDILRQHPDMQIVVTGWCDPRGGREVNEEISIMRAQAVKTWLIKNDINAARITTYGNGIDYKESDSAKARRVDTTINKKEEQR